MKILILGSTGQLGRSLVDFYSGRKSTLLSPSHEELNILDFPRVSSYVISSKVDFLINATAWTNVPGAEFDREAAWNLNALAVENLANICREVNIPLVHVSTDYVFDGNSDGSYRETDIPNPQTFYGKSKRAGEDFIINSGLKNFYIIRTSWLYGRYGKNFVKTIASKAVESEEVSIVNDQFGAPTFAGDIAVGIASILEKRPDSGIYHFSNFGKISWYDLGKAIYGELGSDSSLVMPVKTEEGSVSRPKNSSLNLSKWSESGLTSISPWDLVLQREIPDILKSLR
jgi:dTDP-4-dehydrorhamnose reductase